MLTFHFVLLQVNASDLHFKVDINRFGALQLWVGGFYLFISCILLGSSSTGRCLGLFWGLERFGLVMNAINVHGFEMTRRVVSLVW